MLNDITNFTSKKWASLIGRPRLILESHKCCNINCRKQDYFKMYDKNNYICICGYEISGEFNVIKQKLALYCALPKCNIGKVKMDIDCIKCQHIRERIT